MKRNRIHIGEAFQYSPDFDHKLAEGQRFEEAVANHLRSEGFDSKRFDQRGLARIKKQAGKYDICKRYQRDVILYLPRPGRQRRMLNLEVKAQRDDYWSYPNQAVGSSEGWDKKRFRVDYFIQVNGTTGEARFIPADKESRKSWRRMSFGQELSMSVRLESFRGIDDLVEILREKSMVNVGQNG